MKILILTAFDGEAKGLVSSLITKRRVTIAERNCIYSTLNGHDVYVSYSGIGTSSAASTTTALCEGIGPDCIIMCGSAGGLLPGQNTGDLVIGEKVIDIDLYQLEKLLTGTPYESCLTDPHSKKPVTAVFETPPSLLEAAIGTFLPNVSTGTIVTSNIFPAPKALFDTICELKCSAIEMESTGVLKAAHHYNIPVLAVRAISNSLDQEGNDLGTPATAISQCAERVKDYLHDLFSRIHTIEPVVQESSHHYLQRLIDRHALESHPEGGYYRQTHRSLQEVRAIGPADLRYRGESRVASTSILFLLGRSDYSAWHAIASDEGWKFQSGAPLILRVIHPEENTIQEVMLGNGEGMLLQYTVPAGHIFSAETTGRYTLVGCDVAPGFDFKDFRLIPRAEMLARFVSYPEHHPLILRLTRDEPVESIAAKKESFVPTGSLRAGTC